MNKRCLKYFLLLAFTQSYLRLPAQSFSNEMSFVEKVNVYKVVTFEEFVNRFNNDPRSNIKKAYKYYHIEYKVKRLPLIKSLFDYETKNWDTATINRFATEAIDTRKPKLLNVSIGVFAEVKCRFRYNDADVEVPVVLRYLSDPQRGSKWIICGIGPHPLTLNDMSLPAQKERSSIKFINPVNNEINFTELQKVFENKKNLPEYFETDFFSRKHAVGFYNAVLRDQIHFISVKDVIYHDLQCENWVFTVKDFRRNTLNSGWLINKLTEATAEEKERYLKTLLGE